MKIAVRYEDATLVDTIDLVAKSGGYFDADVQAAVLPYSEEVAEELENRGVKFRLIP